MVRLVGCRALLGGSPRHSPTLGPWCTGGSVCVVPRWLVLRVLPCDPSPLAPSCQCTSVVALCGRGGGETVGLPTPLHTLMYSCGLVRVGR